MLGYTSQVAHNEDVQEPQPQQQITGNKRKGVSHSQNAANNETYGDNAVLTDKAVPKRKPPRKDPGASSAVNQQSAPAATGAEASNPDLPAPDVRQKAPLGAAQLASSEDAAEELLPARRPQFNGPPARNVPFVIPSGRSYRRDKPASMLGSLTPDERMAMQAALGPPIADRLNPNNAAFDPVCAAKYRARRAEDPLYVYLKECKQAQKLLKRVHWTQKSAFTAEEHGYLLDLKGDFPVAIVFINTPVVCEAELLSFV